MKEIKLKVSDENLQTLMNILENLKSGLIQSIEIDGEINKKRQSRYQPKANKVVYEHESGEHDKSGKYISPSAYKARLKKNV
jgi:hypothetical protein